MGVGTVDVSLTQMEESRHGQKDKAHRSDNGMRRNIGSSAEGNDCGKINKYEIIQPAVNSIRKVVPYQKKQVAGKNGKKSIKMKFVAFAPFIFGKHAHPNHDIRNSGQDGKKYGKKTWVEE
ncbi:MAG: hypothetical protein IID17_04515 [Nitrospinae bacterium]|nr:hypothetical protein [Nitrospinota bacterium]